MTTTLASKVRRLFEILDETEESESGHMFHPTTIGSCRTMRVVELEELLPALRKQASEER